MKQDIFFNRLYAKIMVGVSINNNAGLLAIYAEFQPQKNPCGLAVTRSVAHAVATNAPDNVRSCCRHSYRARIYLKNASMFS
jgi:hypothetical protein